MTKLLFDPHRFRVLDALTEPEILLLRRVARPSSVPRRQHIYWPGDPSDRVCFLQAGIVKIAAPLPGGAEALLAFVYPGDVFGELAIVDDAPRDHLTEACEDAKVWSVDRKILLGLLGQSSALSFAFCRLITRGHRRLRTRVEELLHKDAEGRVAQTLLNLAAEHSVADAEGLLIPHRLTQVDLANMAGLTRETVNIVLGSLKTRGFVEMTRNSIRHRQPDALRSVHAMAPAA